MVDSWDSNHACIYLASTGIYTTWQFWWYQFYSIGQLARPDCISTSIEAKLHFIDCIISFNVSLHNLVRAVLGVVNADCFVVNVPLLVLHGKHDLSPLEQTMFWVVKMRVDFDIVATPECFRVKLILVNRSEMRPRIFQLQSEGNNALHTTISCSRNHFLSSNTG